MGRIIKGQDCDPMMTLEGDVNRPQGSVATRLPDRGVIKRDILSAVEQGEGILNEAKKEAKRILQQAKITLKSAAEHVESRRQDGFDQGYQEGLAQVTELISQAHHEHERVLKHAQDEIVNLVMQIAEKIIGREIEQGAIVDIVKQALQGAVGQKIVVRLHPDDLMKLRTQEAELKNMLDHQQTLQLREDTGVNPGGCLVETEVGTIDAQLSTQLEAIKKALGLTS